MRRTRARFAALGALALLIAVIGSVWNATSAQAPVTPLRGTIYAWSDGRLQPVPHAAVTTGAALVRSDAQGRFEFAADERSGRVAVVKPGFDVVRRDVYGDEIAIVLREFVARGIFVPFSESPKPSIQRWIRGLVERGLINTVVFDIKEEAGRVSHYAATETTDAIGATHPDQGMTAFLEELDEMGVYRIGRIVTFLDNRYTAWHPQNTLKHVNGTNFIDSMGLRWSSPFDAETRQYNIEIGVAAAPYFDEIQYDYVRLPYENGLAARAIYASAGREAAITTFAEEAAEAIHLAGAAISFDVFGVISISADDAGIGQSLRSLSEHLDYICPMLYPSGWGDWSFGIRYPPGRPGQVVRLSMEATLLRLAEDSHVEVRPWLQDFHDYGKEGVYYGPQQVRDQIRETAASGGNGFMLWDVALTYEETALEWTADLAWTPRWASG